MGFLRKLAGHILDGVGTVIEVIGTVTHIEPIADLGLSISINVDLPALTVPTTEISICFFSQLLKNFVAILLILL